MMLRRAVLKFFGALTLLAGLGVAQEASAAEVIKVATLAPKSSPWGQVFSLWEKAVKDKSGGRVEIQFSYNGQINGQQGDEAAMVAKMKSGQLDGAAVTSVGLSKIYKPILALQLPGLFRSWTKLDAARDAMKNELELGLTDAGFTLAGWGDVGQVHIMSKGFAVRTPADLKGKKPYMWRDDPMAPFLYQIVGGVTPVPLNVQEVLPQLNTGAVNIVMTATLAAEQLQWASKLDTIVADVSGTAIGALVFSNRRLSALPDDLRKVVVDTGRIAALTLTTRIRNEDMAALDRMKQKMTVVTLTASEASKWDALYKQVRQQLSKETFAPDLIAKLEKFAR